MVERVVGAPTPPREAEDSGARPLRAEGAPAGAELCRGPRAAAIMEAMVTTPALIVYTRPDCSYSDALVHDLDKDGIDYEQIDLEVHPEQIPEVERLTGGERITPVMVEGDLVIIGYHGVG